MAPHLRTYSKKSNSTFTKSFDAVNALFAQNLCKRNRTKMKKKNIECILKDLPNPDKNHSIINTSGSLVVRKDDPFDNLLTGENYNNVILKTNLNKSNTNDSTKSVTTPVLPTPKVFRRKYRTLKPKIVIDKTLDKSVSLSLEVEVEAKKKTLDTLALTKSDIDEQSRTFQPLFNKSLYDDYKTRKVLMSSTPMVTLKSKNFVNETLSPIPTKTLFEQSLQQIEEWNYKPPDVLTLSSKPISRKKLILDPPKDSVNAIVTSTKTSSKQLKCICPESKELIVKIKALPDKLVYELLEKQKKKKHMEVNSDVSQSFINDKVKEPKKLIKSGVRRRSVHSSKINNSLIENNISMSSSPDFAMENISVVDNCLQFKKKNTPLLNSTTIAENDVPKSPKNNIKSRRMTNNTELEYTHNSMDSIPSTADIEYLNSIILTRGKAKELKANGVNVLFQSFDRSAMKSPPKPSKRYSRTKSTSRINETSSFDSSFTRILRTRSKSQGCLDIFNVSLPVLSSQKLPKVSETILTIPDQTNIDSFSTQCRSSITIPDETGISNCLNNMTNETSYNPSNIDEGMSLNESMRIKINRIMTRQKTKLEEERSVSIINETQNNSLLETRNLETQGYSCSSKANSKIDASSQTIPEDAEMYQTPIESNTNDSNTSFPNILQTTNKKPRQRRKSIAQFNRSSLIISDETRLSEKSIDNGTSHNFSINGVSNGIISNKLQKNNSKSRSRRKSFSHFDGTSVTIHDETRLSDKSINNVTSDNISLNDFTNGIITNKLQKNNKKSRSRRKSFAHFDGTSVTIHDETRLSEKSINNVTSDNISLNDFTDGTITNKLQKNNRKSRSRRKSFAHFDGTSVTIHDETRLSEKSINNVTSDNFSLNDSTNGIITNKMQKNNRKPRSRKKSMSQLKRTSSTIPDEKSPEKSVDNVTSSYLNLELNSFEIDIGSPKKKSTANVKRKSLKRGRPKSIIPSDNNPTKSKKTLNETVSDILEIHSYSDISKYYRNLSPEQSNSRNARKSKSKKSINNSHCPSINSEEMFEESQQEQSRSTNKSVDMFDETNKSFWDSHESVSHTRSCGTSQSIISNISKATHHETLAEHSTTSDLTSEVVNESEVGKSRSDTPDNIDILAKSIDDSVSSFEDLDLRVEDCNSVLIDIMDSVIEENRHMASFNKSSGKNMFLGWTGRKSAVYDGSSTDSEKDVVADDMFVIPKRIVIKPGKLYRRSMAVIKRETMDCWPTPKICGTSCTCAKCKQKVVEVSLFRQSVRVVPEPPPPRDKRVTNSKSKSGKGYVPDSLQDSHNPIDKFIEDISVRNREVSNNSERFSLKDTQVFTARDVVLRRCGQTEPIPFSGCYPNTLLKNCHKIGEGVYGEVFLYRNMKGTTSVMKVIPIEGDQIVNGERQKKFDEIISEVIIALELSNLRNNTKNATTGFNEVHSVHCVKGKYPERLLELWDLYDEDKGSENDCPDIFTDDQLYIVLELANGGKDLESFVFNNAQQAYALFKQTAFSLAVAETSLQFEHRDLHWGNILISNTDKNSKLTYNLNGRQFDIPTHGVEVSIIDFTLSRITADGVCVYNDLGQDPDFFNADGDYQFEIYRLMQKCNGNDWQHFEPHTNILWLHYTLDKMITALRYKYTKTKCHATYIQKLKELKDTVLEYKSVEEFVTVNFV